MPLSIFSQLDKCLFSFIWNGKQPHIHKTLMEEPKHCGELALPYLLHYYWAINIQRVIEWVQTCSDPTALIWMESQMASIHSLATSPDIQDAN